MCDVFSKIYMVVALPLHVRGNISNVILSKKNDKFIVDYSSLSQILNQGWNRGAGVDWMASHPPL